MGIPGINKLQDDINTENYQKNRRSKTVLRKQIAELNVLIARVETAGNKANDYYDQRNNLVDRLSRLVQVEVRELPNGQMDVLVGGYFCVSREPRPGLSLHRIPRCLIMLCPK